MSASPNDRRHKRHLRGRNERLTFARNRQLAPKIKTALRTLGVDLPFYEFLDSYEAVFQEMANEGMSRFKSLVGIHEADRHVFEDTDWRMFRLDPSRHVQFLLDDCYDGYGKRGVDEANINGASAFFLNDDGGFRSIVLMPRKPRGEIKHPDTQYALKIAVLAHELGHISDAEQQLNIDPLAPRFDVVAAEAFANCYALEALAARALRQSYIMLYDAIAAQSTTEGYVGDIARLVVSEHERRAIPDWQEHWEAVEAMLSK